MLKDTPELRELLTLLFDNPKLVIEGPAKASGQRVVYFCQFEELETDRSFEDSLEDASTWGPVVLKISQTRSPQTTAYLMKEVEILGSMANMHYPTLHFDRVFNQHPVTGDSFSHLLFVTIEERVDARSLSDCTEDFGDEKSILKLLEKLVEALKIMWEHPSRLIHRDIKPDNILIRSNNDVVIIDLGIVREEGVDGNTNSFSPWGPCSILYASPEQARNQKRLISFKSDFFSLGTLAYELAAKAHPFGSIGEEIGIVLDRICCEDPPKLHDRIGCSRKFSELIERLLCKQPYRRFRRIEDLEDAIKNTLSVIP